MNLPFHPDRESPAFGSSSGRFLLYLAYSALLCLVFALLGFPRPHVDDPFYVGTAEHLARTGELYNPYLRNWMVPFTPGKFLSQFPLYPFLLGGWMKIAGIGTVPVLVFFAFVNFFCCLFAGWFFRRARLSDALFIVFPWLILSLGQTQGFRSDLPGLCAFWISAACITYPDPQRIFVATLSACAAILLWPVILGFVCPVFAVYLIIHWRAVPTDRRPAWILRSLGALFAGGVAAFGSFLWMISFEWHSFLNDFLLMTSLRRPGGNTILEAFLGLSWARYDHLFLASTALLSGFFLYWSLRPRALLSTSTRLWILETALGSLLAIILYAVNTQLIYFFFWLALFAVTAEFIKIGAKKEIFLIAVFSIGLLFQAVNDAKNLLPAATPEVASVAGELAEHPGATVVFDEIAYRYLYNLQPPPNSLAWLCLRPAPALGATLSDKKPGEIWVMSEQTAFPGGTSDRNKIVLIK